MRYLDGVHRISSLPFRCHYGLLLIGLLLAAPVDRALGFDDRVSVGPAHEAPVKTTGIGSPLFLTEDDGYTSESPEMAPHTDGSFSVVWVDRRDGNQEIYYAKVSANGSVLIAARNISQSAAASTRPDVAVDGLGNAHICWLEGSSVVLSRVDAFGTEFLDNYVVSTGNCSWPAVAATGSGESWLGYRRTGLLQFYLYMAKVNAAGLRVCESVAAQNALYDYDNWTTLDWNTAGQTFMGFADVWNFQEFAAVQLWDGSCQLWAPFCGSRHRVFDSNEIAHTSISSGVMSAIYIVFSDNQGTGRKVYTMTACFAAALLSDTPGPSYDPQVATPEGTNCALVVWEDHSGPSGEIRLRIENRSEPSFSLSTSLTGNSTNPSLALVDCEHWAAVWQNDQGGQNEIVFMSTESAPPPPTGACCLPDGSCVIRTAEECAAQGGTYHGDGSACDPSPCLPAPTTGACCLADGSCITTTEQDCEAQGGCYQGDDVLCESVMCSASAAMPIGSPWPAGSTWQGGGRGSYYHQGYHGSLPGIQRSEFAIDFNLDSGNDRGYPILAAKEGDVVVSVPDDGGCPPGRGSFGNYVEIRHGTYQGESTTTLYTHLLEAPFVIEGEHILQGAVVGLCGATGCADGEHLHFEEREDGWSVPITSMDCYDWCDVPCGEPSSCCSHVLTSCNTALLDSAYARNGGVEMIGEPEYDMCTSEGVPDYHPWFWAWDPADLYGPHRTPRNCILQHLRGGYYWDSAIVYDGLAGARQAYVLHSGFWTAWTNAGGPHSTLGMPITNEYSEGEGGARQDFQLGYLSYDGGEVTPRLYNVCASDDICGPGMTKDGWDPRVSYRIADKYALEGAPNPHEYWGDAMEPACCNGSTWRQQFANRPDDPLTIEIPGSCSPGLWCPPVHSPELAEGPALQPISFAVTPNPTGASCSIRLGLTAAATVELSVFDVSGRRICVVAPSESRLAGEYTLTWDKRDENGRLVAPGIYYLWLVTPTKIFARPVTLVR